MGLKMDTTNSETILPLSAQIIEHLLSAHFPNDARRLELGPARLSLLNQLGGASQGASMSGILSTGTQDGNNSSKSSTTAAGTSCGIWSAFEEMRDMLMDMNNDLPLAISRVAPAGAGFSYDDEEDVVNEDCSSSIKTSSNESDKSRTSTTSSSNSSKALVSYMNATRRVEDVVVEFEWSSLWPRDSEQAIKVFQGAFLLEMKTQLAERCDIPAFVGEEGPLWTASSSTGAEASSLEVDVSTASCSPWVTAMTNIEARQLPTSTVPAPQPFLDVVFPKHVFRLRVFYPYLPSVVQNARFVTFGAMVKSKDVQELLKAAETGEKKTSATTGINGDNKEQDNMLTTSSNVSVSAADLLKEQNEATPTKDEEEDQFMTQNSSLISSFGTTASNDALTELREHWWRPRVRQAFHTLALEQPTFCLTWSLVKKWLASKWLLHGHEDFFEHLVASLFARVSSVSFCGLPTSANVGFARFLTLCAAHGTTGGGLSGEAPIVLEDFGFAPPEMEGAETGLAHGFSTEGTEQTQLSEEQLHLLQSSYERRRGSTREAVVAVCTRFDPHGVFVRTPKESHLIQLKEHSRKALAALHEQNWGRWTTGCSEETSSRTSSTSSKKATAVTTLFQEQAEEFDLQVKLSAIPSLSTNGKSKKPNSAIKQHQHSHFSDLGTTALNSVADAFWRKLSAKYGEWAVLFRRGNDVALKWRPEAFDMEKSGVKQLMHRGCSYRAAAASTGDKEDTRPSSVLPQTEAMLQDISYWLTGVSYQIIAS
ncbi:unnamed protein product [Amoebophrya sp. A25]|nr:unnamed protein product [Amoebophrya sp. A25]|eukprot:GSA25T00002991001.1